MSPLHQLALTLLPGVGPVHARKLLEYYGSAEALFNESGKDLVRRAGISPKLARSFAPSCRRDALKQAELELRYLERSGSRLLSYLDKAYPRRLKQCYDAPVVLFYHGNIDFENSHVLSIVGTRRATAYGVAVCEALIEQLVPYHPLIISGLAYGIDVAAHRAALKYGLPTLAVLGHGLAHVYPQAHRGIAGKIKQEGGLLTEFFHDTAPVPENFPKRNRIVAGLSDATLVVEAGEKGGALITANLAMSYDRDVFALPGRLSDTNSMGCLKLIKNQQAQLITKGEDVAWYLNWEQVSGSPDGVRKKSIEISDQEREIIRVIQENDGVSLDYLAEKVKISKSTVFYSIMKLEISGIIKNTTGKGYEIIKIP